MASFRCYDNSDVIATLIMTNFHLYLMQLWWQFSQCLLGIDPEKLYRGTFICQNGLSCYIIWASFLFDCFVKIWATCKNFLGKWFTAPPPWPKIARTPMRAEDDPGTARSKQTTSKRKRVKSNDCNKKPRK